LGNSGCWMPASSLQERGGEQLAHFITWTPEAIPGGNDVATNTTGRGDVFLNIWEIITII